MTHEQHQYFFSRSHASRVLIDAMNGIAPPELRFRILPDEGQPVCGGGFRYSKVVYPTHCAPGREPDVTCPRCRALMRALRPQSAPLHEVRRDHAGRPVGYVGGEMFARFADYEARVS